MKILWMVIPRISFFENWCGSTRVIKKWQLDFENLNVRVHKFLHEKRFHIVNPVNIQFIT